MTMLDLGVRIATPLHPPAPAHGLPSRAGSGFREWLVLRAVAVERGRRAWLPLSRTEDVARALRNALLCHAVDPPPAALSGHAPSGRRLERPHTAFLALPDLRANGSSAVVAGVAIVLPPGIGSAERQAILLAAARWERSGLRLVMGRLGALQLARVDTPAAGDGLDPAAWMGPSRHWASVTPIALERNPGKLTSDDREVAARAAQRAAEIVARACAHAGLPAPVNVCVMRRSVFSGVPHAPEFMPFPRPHTRRAPDKFQRVCLHAQIEFSKPLEGPVLLGAGRYFGVGLLRPLVE